MEKIKYQLKTISSLVVSPRSNLAWYKELKEFNLDMIPDSIYLNKDRLKVIYPFYQYGEYKEWSRSAKYYLPGSSLKGALCEKLTRRNNIMVDDIQIPNEYIVLRNLYKVQFLMDPEKAELNNFFENVGVEMVEANTNLYGELYLKEAGDIIALINGANGSAKIKMGQMVKYLTMLFNENYKDDLKIKLHKTITRLESFIQDGDVILLGGFKGLLHSMEVESVTPLDMNENGAIFIDPETDLLHGLVRIQVL